MKIDVFNHVFPPALFAELGRYLPAAPMARYANNFDRLTPACRQTGLRRRSKQPRPAESQPQSSLLK